MSDLVGNQIVGFSTRQLKYCLRPREHFWQALHIRAMKKNKANSMIVSLFQDDRLKTRSMMER